MRGRCRVPPTVADQTISPAIASISSMSSSSRRARARGPSSVAKLPALCVPHLADALGRVLQLVEARQERRRRDRYRDGQDPRFRRIAPRPATAAGDRSKAMCMPMVSGRRGTESGEPIRHGCRRADPTVRCLPPPGEQDDADNQGSDEHAPRHQHEAIDVHPTITDCPSRHADREPPRTGHRHGDGHRGGADRHRQRTHQIGHHELAAADSQGPEEAPVRALRTKLPGHGRREEERRHDGGRQSRERQQSPSLRADLTVHRLAVPRPGCRPRPRRARRTPAHQSDRQPRQRGPRASPLVRGSAAMKIP